MRFVPTYRPRASALHSARAGVAAAFCGSLAFAGALYQHPLVLGAALLAIGLAAAGAGVAREVRSAAWVALSFALLVSVINPLVYQEGDTLLVRGGEVLGRRFDITLEATVAGALAGVRVVVIILALWLMSVAVDPDALLRLFRRISYRSALTASLATRLVPVLARDASRMSDAARCRPRPAGRLAVARSALAGALDRSVDLAAALELRGYALAGRPAPRRVPWSRHDARLAAAAVGIAALTVAGRVAGVASVEAYPELSIELGAPELALAAAIVLLAAAPFAGRAARMGVAGA
ncbi:MAG TPA: energy-coupling factor transporter transmembrane component T [Thermoleophilaceae bacterium]|nr:energy-coupling factor transporter transmembrane component T [Thermoleophilaceae bacterium]